MLVPGPKCKPDIEVDLICRAATDLTTPPNQRHLFPPPTFPLSMHRTLTNIIHHHPGLLHPPRPPLHQSPQDSHRKPPAPLNLHQVLHTELHFPQTSLMRACLSTRQVFRGDLSRDYVLGCTFAELFLASNNN